MIAEKNNTKPKKSGKSEPEKSSARKYPLESIMALQKALETGMVDASCDQGNSSPEKAAAAREAAHDWRGTLRRVLSAPDRALYALRRRLAFFLLGNDKSRPTYGGLR